MFVFMLCVCAYISMCLTPGNPENKTVCVQETADKAPSKFSLFGNNSTNEK